MKAIAEQEDRMAEKLKITVSRQDMEADIATVKTVTLRERLLRRLFGYKRKVTVLIPGERISQLSIEQTGGDESEHL